MTHTYQKQMNYAGPHSFHIPVMGLGYTIDTPLKVARYGINSVVSIIEDHLVENMREIHCRKENLPYIPVKADEPDARARRVTLYLDMLDTIIRKQLADMQKESFEDRETDINRYFTLLDDESPLKKVYLAMQAETNPNIRRMMQRFLKARIVPGEIDVNIMTKVDRINYAEDGTPLPAEFSDASAALRGYANSVISSSIVFSAGMNPHLYGYCAKFPDFFPDENGVIKKKIIIKVSDFRSAHIQGKFLAKKGLWVSEFRIESGLNCGGHAFAADGKLIGPILEEFLSKRDELTHELFGLWNTALGALDKTVPQVMPEIRVTVQGGIGTHTESTFLKQHYRVDSIGWGSIFLLAPDVTNVDAVTLSRLATAKPEDYYLSYASPLGIPFNNFRLSTSEEQRKDRIRKNRPGSPCYKKFLSTNTEFTEIAICTASREYQKKKLEQLESSMEPNKAQRAEEIMEKDCLCEGLGASAMVVNGAESKLKVNGITICPGPNLAFFSGTFSLTDVVDHIYGRKTIRNTLDRPHVFINELKLNMSYLEDEIRKSAIDLTEKTRKRLDEYRKNLLEGIEYYKSLLPSIRTETELFKAKMNQAFDQFRSSLEEMQFGEPVAKVAV